MGTMYIRMNGCRERGRYIWQTGTYGEKRVGKKKTKNIQTTHAPRPKNPNVQTTFQGSIAPQSAVLASDVAHPVVTISISISRRKSLVPIKRKKSSKRKSQKIWQCFRSDILRLCTPCFKYKVKK